MNGFGNNSRNKKCYRKYIILSIRNNEIGRVIRYNWKCYHYEIIFADKYMAINQFTLKP